MIQADYVDVIVNILKQTKQSFDEFKSSTTLLTFTFGKEALTDL